LLRPILFDGREGCLVLLSNSPARDPRFRFDMQERPSLRPLAPLLGVLAAMWLAALGLIAQQVV
jgi:hypothetical protein